MAIRDTKILLKKGSINNKNLFLNKFTILGYGILVISTLCTTLAYSEIKISTGVIIESLSYIFIPILSYKLLKEQIKKEKIIAMFFIILGIIIFNL